MINLRARLVEDWKLGWRFWSVRLSAIGALVSVASAAAPGFVLDSWNSLPGEIRDLIPQQAGRILAALIFSASIIARLFKQRDPSDGK